MKKEVAFESEGYCLSGLLYEGHTANNTAALFCHGAFEYQDHWISYAERLRDEGLTTMTFDFPGHGRSEGLRGMVNLRVWAYNIRDALNYLAKHGYQRFALVGWGCGGSAVVLAAAHDRRVECAVTLAAPVFLMPPFGERVALGAAILISRVKRAIWKQTMTLSRVNDLGNIRYTVDEQTNQRFLSDPRLISHLQTVPVEESLDCTWSDITQAAKKVNIPLLVIHGKQDQVLPAEQSSRLYEIAQGQKVFKLIEGCGHALHLDSKRDEVFNLIAQWIKRHLH